MFLHMFRFTKFEWEVFLVNQSIKLVEDQGFFVFLNHVKDWTQKK